MGRKLSKTTTRIALFLIAAFAGGLVYFRYELRPAAPGKGFHIRYEHPTPLVDVLDYLQGHKVIVSAPATRLYALLTRRHRTVAKGTYLVQPGMSAAAILGSLSKPIVQDVRLPETNWAKRTANVLELHEVAKADEYMTLVKDPARFKGEVPFPIEGDSLEGYLYPDTYDLPPLLGAEPVVEKQLKAFEKKVWEPLKEPKNLRRALIIASLVQLEVARDSERPIVAGVIENRLARNMPLQIDATVLYARQKWGLLSIKELTSIKSPYNTYLHKGLPPGPICSPSIKSIEAALHPAKHDFLYYVAMPDGHQLFAKTMAEHEKNIKLRKAAMAVVRALR